MDGTWVGDARIVEGAALAVGGLRRGTRRFSVCPRTHAPLLLLALAMLLLVLSVLTLATAAATEGTPFLIESATPRKGVGVTVIP